MVRAARGGAAAREGKYDEYGKDRTLRTVSDAAHVYAKKGKYTACVKVVDTFGWDTSITVRVEV